MNISTPVLKCLFMVVPLTGALLACAADPAFDDEKMDEPVAETSQAVIPGASIIQVFGSVQVPGYTSGRASAFCPAGSISVGGGFVGDRDMNVTRSTPSYANGWYIDAFNSSPYPKTLYSEAHCLSGTNARVAEGSVNFTSIPPYSIGCATATCGAGTLLTGGGFIANEAGGFEVATQMTWSNGWRVCGRNQTGSSMMMESWAVCIANVSGTYSQYASSLTIPNMSIYYWDTSCPAGLLRSSGGFTLGQGNGWTALRSYSPSGMPQTWRNYMYNHTGASQYVTGYVTCLDLR